MTLSPYQADRRFAQLRKLTQVSRALTYAVSLDDVLALTVGRAAELLEAEKSVLMLVNDEGLLSVRASHGLDKTLCDRFREPLHETLISRLQGLLGEAEGETFLGVPLVVSGEVTGILAVARPPAVELIEEQEWLLSALADQAAVALEKTRLDETAEFRERLIGIVSHDLRDPISAISMAAEVLLARNGLDDRTTKTVVRIQNSADRATRLISDLLDFTQARLGGGIVLDRRPADLRAIVRPVVEELELTHPERTFVVTLQGDGHGQWDPDRISQVVGNLLANAVHYSPADTVIRLTAQDDGEDLLLTVHNQGKPIPAERLPQIFEPLRRAASELTKSSRSVGLGLYIVKHIVEAHRGSVSVESTQENGTTLSVRLPRHAEPPGH